MIQNQCCGVDNYLDFENATKWTRELNRTKLVIPMACCRIPSTDLECSRMPRDYNSHFLTGCFPKFKDKIERWKDTILAIGGTIVGVQISMVFLVLYVMNQLGIDVWFRELILKPLGLSELPPEPTPEPITPA
ncbi:tetraspanin-21-like [Pomacea canaliculata]|uniref:tetraspanin-21-like n=1 Tax=Pomacea canaliculata TaxID=400727 RepID=UPI000D7294D6|nr:tetraspanin-21-like [Pomacea canaliculata]